MDVLKNLGSLRGVFSTLINGGKLELSQVPAICASVGMPDDEVACIQTAVEALQRDRENPKRGLPGSMMDLFYNWKESGPVHWFYVGFLLIEAAHGSFDSKTEAGEENAED